MSTDQFHVNVVTKGASGKNSVQSMREKFSGLNFGQESQQDLPPPPEIQHAIKESGEGDQRSPNNRTGKLQILVCVLFVKDSCVHGLGQAGVTPASWIPTMLLYLQCGMQGHVG